MSQVPRLVGFVLIVSGAIMIVVGGVAYYLVHDQLSAEKIVVSDDAEWFAGEPVEGPFTAYSQANVIRDHALDMADGMTYAQLPRDDERRETVMDASFLRASLFTSVVAFGVAFLVGALGVLFILIGVTILALVKAIGAPVEPGAHSVVDDPSPDSEPDTDIAAEPATATD